MDMATVTAMIIVTATAMDMGTITVTDMIITTGMITSTHTIMDIMIMIMRTRILTIITGTHTTMPTHTIMGIPIPTSTIITGIRTGKAAKSSWNKTFSPTITCLPSAIAAILKRRTSPH